MSSSSSVVYEGWMVRYGRRKIGRSFVHTRYFVLEPRMLSYYKRKPQHKADKVGGKLPIKSLPIDGNCRVEDRGLKMHHGHVLVFSFLFFFLVLFLIFLLECYDDDPFRALPLLLQMLYVLCVYNKREKHNRITMAAFNIQEALIWKEKIEMVIDQQQGVAQSDGNRAFISSQQKASLENGRKSSSSDHESQYSREEEEEEEDNQRSLLRRTTIGNGPPESLYDWTRENDLGISNQGSPDQVFSRGHWRLVRCQNGLRIFEELQDVDYLARSCSRAMKAVGVVEASCEAIFQLVMSMDTTRFEWDCSFQYGSLVEEVDGHTAILYHRLQLDWFPMFVWPRDLCYVRYWRRNDDGSYGWYSVVLFQSREHPNCGPQPGFVRAHIESGGFNISPLKSRNGRTRTQVQHLMQIDLKGWGVGYVPSFQQHCLIHMLNSVAGTNKLLNNMFPPSFSGKLKMTCALLFIVPFSPLTGLREWFSQSDESQVLPRIPVMVNMTPSVSSGKARKAQENTTQTSLPMDPSRHLTVLEEESDEDDEFLIPESEQEVDELLIVFPVDFFCHFVNKTMFSMQPSTREDAANVRQPGRDEEDSVQIDLSGFSGNLRRDDRDNSRDCWRISDGNNFRVRSKNFVYDKSKVPAGKPLMELVAVDWFKDAKRMDHVARRKGCAVQVAAEKGLFALAINLQVPGTTNYSMVFYFVMKKLIPNSLLQRFVDGDDEFRNSRFKLIPSVPKGSWIVRQSVGSTPCLLGKAVDITYIRGANYLEIDVDIGSSTVANGVLGLVCGVITTLVVDMAFLVQGNTYEELPERLIGAVRMSHIELSSAIVPVLED
ncbi:Protein ENHANCED DISEASE RESISTANCE 2 [Dichanthelium oligosanthes]|uniref:Protein ENHANCED DISEASE RESISTANCE 2 n=1 Tax=Dichanthelium oligosanthes TaxID=888268 RepID=A0A1E5ULF9_9POAL|nr:Protein ENHANCED DISEASE RESISTANCE 2 [Dichanthelium oligosanthes]